MSRILRCEPMAAFLDETRGGRRLLVCLGDSNTCNTGFTQGAKQWPELLHSALKDAVATQNLVLVNAGVSGDTVEDALARFEHDVGRFRPGLCIVCLGSNDANRLDDRRFAAGLAAICDRLGAAGSRVLLRTPTPVWERKPSRIWPDDHRLQAVVAVIRALAAERSLPLVDTYGMWQDAAAAGTLDIAGLMSDEVHTNAIGHRLVFRQLLPAFGLAMPIA